MQKTVGSCLFVTLIAWTAASAAQLPVKPFTTADGLARNTILCIIQDARGFLWFCTSDGLSRFDGYGFTNYGTEHGLPNSSVTSLLVSRRGLYWVGTPLGLFRFDPNSPPPQKFKAVQVGDGRYAVRVTSILEDRSGSLWLGTEQGLYRLRDGEQAWEVIDAGIPIRSDGWSGVHSLLEDQRGVLWIGGADGLYRRTPDGQTAEYAYPPWRRGPVMALYQDREGRIWASDNVALYRINPDAASEDSIVSRVYTVKDGLPSNRIAALLESSDGQLWAAGFGGMGQYLPALDKFERYTTEEGLVDEDLKSLAEDTHGNLWVGTASAGAIKIARHGFTSYTQADGLSNIRIGSVVVDQAGELCVWSNLARTLALNCFNGSVLHPSIPNTRTRSVISAGAGVRSDFRTTQGNGGCRPAKVSAGSGKRAMRNNLTGGLQRRSIRCGMASAGTTSSACLKTRGAIFGSRRSIRQQDRC